MLDLDHSPINWLEDMKIIDFDQFSSYFVDTA